MIRFHYKTYRQVRINGDMKDRNSALDWCYKHGYKVLTFGPKYIGNYRYDTTKFFVVARKEIK